MAASPIRWLYSSMIALVLVATALPSSPASAQAFDCSGNDWVATSSAEFDAALACWEATTEPGDYSITLTGNLDTRPAIGTRSGDFTLTVDGAGVRLSEGLTVSGSDRDPIDQASPITIRNLQITSGGLSIVKATANVEDVEVSDLGVGIVSADVRLTRVSILRMDDVNAVNAGFSRVLLEDSIIGAVEDDPAFIIEDSLFVVRNSIVREATGLYEYVDDSEILFDRSAIIDNDTNLSAYVSSYCCEDTTISYINSTFAQDDENGDFFIGIGERERSLVQVANTTVLDNGPYGIIGPLDVQSSIVDRCEEEAVRPQDPAAIYVGRPIDLGGNVGGCFGDGPIFEYPLADYGCTTPTPFGCVPTIATNASSPARGAGICSNTIIPTPTDLFSIDFADLEPGVNSVLTTSGTQTIDGRGFPRTSCDAGSYESDGNEPTTPDTLRIATWDLNHPPASDEIAFFYDGEFIGQFMVDEDIDVLFVQRALRGPVGGHVFDRITATLWFLGIGTLYDFAPAYDSGDALVGTDAYFIGQGIFSPRPILSRSTTELASPDPGGVPTVIQEVILDTSPEPLRLVNVRSHDDSPCTFIAQLSAWLDSQPEMTTILGGNFAADRSLGCVGEFAAGWVDACASLVAQASCDRTIRPESEITDATQDLLLHRPASTSTFTLTDAATERTSIPFTDHRAVIATYDLAGAAQGDADGDGIDDSTDDCPTVANDVLDDADGDGVGDVCDPVLDGDANCDDTRDIIDALVIAQYDAGVRTDASSCTIGDPATELYAYGADANNDGTTDIIDALVIAQCSAGIANATCPPTPEAD